MLHGARGITQDKKTGEWGYRYSLTDKPGALGVDYGPPQKKQDGNRAATSNSKSKPSDFAKSIEKTITKGVLTTNPNQKKVNFEANASLSSGNLNGEYTPSNVGGTTAKLSASIAKVNGNISYIRNGNGIFASTEGDFLSASGAISTPGANGPYVEGEVGAYTLKGDLSGGLSLWGYRASVTVGGSAMSAHAGGGFGIYFDDKGTNFKVFEHLGWGLGQKAGLIITIPYNKTKK